MNKLMVFYDDQCPLCRRCRAWVQAQPTYLPIEFWPLHAPATWEKFPDLKRFEPEKDLVVFTDEGAVYQGTNAWLLILWNLRNWRHWSVRLAQPQWRPYVRRFWNWISQHRFTMLEGTMGDEEALLRTLHTVPPDTPDLIVRIKTERNQ